MGGGIGAGIAGLRSHHDKKEIKEDAADVLPPDSSGIVAMFEAKWASHVDGVLSNADSVTKRDVDADSANEVKDAAEAS